MKKKRLSGSWREYSWRCHPVLNNIGKSAIRSLPTGLGSVFHYFLGCRIMQRWLIDQAINAKLSLAVKV
jgi:hypothetical protein